MIGARALAVFLVCLVASSTFVAATGFNDVLSADREFGHEDELEDVEEDFGEPGADGGGDSDSLGTVASFFIGAFNMLQTLVGLVFFFPQALANLGLPPAAAAFVSAPVYIVVGITFMEFLRGAMLR